MFYVWLFLLGLRVHGESRGGTRPRRGFEYAIVTWFVRWSEFENGVGFIFSSSGWRIWGGERTKKELLAVSCEGINEPMLSLFFRPLAESFSLLHSINSKNAVLMNFGEAFPLRFNNLFFQVACSFCVFFSYHKWFEHLTYLFQVSTFTFIYLFFLDCTETPPTSTTFYSSLPLQTPPSPTQIHSMQLSWIFISYFLHFLSLTGWNVETKVLLIPFLILSFSTIVCGLL